MENVEIMSGPWKGCVGHLSYDHFDLPEGQENDVWITFHSMGHTHDILAKSVEYKMLDK